MQYVIATYRCSSFGPFCRLSVTFSSIFFYNVAGIIWQKHVQRYLHLIRQELTDHYFEDGKSHHAGSVQNRMTNDLTLLHNDYLNSFRYVAGMLVSVFSVALTLFTFQWSLLLACLTFLRQCRFICLN